MIDNYTQTCPRCGGLMIRSTDWYYNTTTWTCIECYYYYTEQPQLVTKLSDNTREDDGS